MTAEEQNALCEHVQYLIAVGDPLTAEDKAHLDACRACKAFELDMASLDEALPTLAAGELTNKKGQTVADAVEKELALQQRFTSSKSVPKAFRHVGFAAAAVVVLIGGLVVMKTRQAMKPAGSAFLTSDLMMFDGTAFEAAESVYEDAECEECPEFPVEEETENEGGMTLFSTAPSDNKEAENTANTYDYAARAAEKEPTEKQTAPEKPKQAVTFQYAPAHEDNAVVPEKPTEEPMLMSVSGYVLETEEKAQPTEEAAVFEEEAAAEKPASNGGGGGAARNSNAASADGMLMKSAQPETKDEAVAEDADEETVLMEPAAEAADMDALPPLTMQMLEALAKKGDVLTWEDFTPFDGEDVGSGLYIMRYDIDERYYVLVGGVPNEKPLYIMLCDALSADRSIDVRTDDIEAFLRG